MAEARRCDGQEGRGTQEQSECDQQVAASLSVAQRCPGTAGTAGTADTADTVPPLPSVYRLRVEPPPANQQPPPRQVPSKVPRVKTFSQVPATARSMQQESCLS